MSEQRMHERTLELLDFFRIRENVAGYALSAEGNAEVAGALPLTDPLAVAALKAKVEALRYCFRDGRSIPQTSYQRIDDALRVISKPGTCLELGELWSLGMWADSYEIQRRWMLGVKHEELKAILESAPVLEQVASTAFRVVGKDGEVRDLPELRDIRVRIQKINQDIERTTASFFQDEQSRAMLQSDLPTQRDGRTVLAVKAGSKARIKGIVHEVSATGQTVFIEPEALVQKNNQLVEEEARYQRELLRILRETTAKLHNSYEAVQAARHFLSLMDALYARARYSHLHDGVFAEPCETGLKLVKARHPILGAKAVPIDLQMPDEARTLIITGPNTGGKTVSLKTAGLFSLMNQFGLALPAGYGTALPVFDGVWADIGDEQSIDQSLSTFSGHMRTISAIVAGATGRSLVLLDELGSGTDPEEGCAIAMALLDLFIDRGALIMVTTHHGILKNFGYTKAGVLNASVDFDKDTLSPTYRILMGIPGESRALEIAVKNGLSAEVVNGAKAYLRDERTDVSAMIRGLSAKHQELDSLRVEEKQRLREAMDEQRKADLKELQLRQKEAELRTQGVSELKELLSESRKTLENLVRALREEELTKEKTQEVKDFLLALEEKVLGADRELKLQVRSLKPGAKLDVALAPGLPVLILPARKRGRIVRAGKKGYWLVETDAMRLTVDAADLEPAEELKAQAPSVTVEAARDRSNRAVLELDLRGYRLVEAIDALERQLDAAVMEGLHGFSIIHGTGEGILQQGVRETLSRYPGIAAFHYARPEEGGHGKTVVEFGS
ncbi:MAG TPA: endonuclease MutS2 [Spirochaetales bacterium]|nr:endonuclease MutS2 [Spirochaetales bacterium]